MFYEKNRLRRILTFFNPPNISPFLIFYSFPWSLEGSFFTELYHTLHLKISISNKLLIRSITQITTALSQITAGLCNFRTTGCDVAIVTSVLYSSFDTIEYENSIKRFKSTPLFLILFSLGSASTYLNGNILFKWAKFFLLPPSQVWAFTRFSSRFITFVFLHIYMQFYLAAWFVLPSIRWWN